MPSTHAAGHPRAARAAAVGQALAEALAVLFPTWCAGCDEPDVGLCALCRAALEPEPRVQVLADGLRVRSGLAFDGVAARALRALKEDGRTGLARPLARALTAAMRGEDWSDAVAVPVPSSRAAMRRRGYAVAELLARRAGLAPQRLLVPARRTADQRGLARAERAENLAGALRSRPAAGRRVVIVDDVVTTGATLAEAARALRAAGADVVGAVTVAATPLRRTGTGGFARELPGDRSPARH